MNIKLTKDEWEFLKYIVPEGYRYLATRSFEIIESIEEKLGSEWVDDASK